MPQSVFGYLPTYLDYAVTDLSDIAKSPAPADGQSLVYDAATQQYKPATLVPPGSTNLIGSNSTSSVDGSIVTWDGTNAQNITDSKLVAATAVYYPADLKYRQRVQNVDAPTLSDDAATKAYVDAALAAVQWKQAVVAATTANIATLSGATASANTDGVTLVTGNRVLVWQQATATQNGVYVYSSTGAWTRAADYASGTHVGDFVCKVQQGTLYAENAFACTNDAPADVAGTDALSFAIFSQIATAGQGLTKTNSVFDVNVDNITMQINGLNQLICTLFPAGTLITHVSTSVPGYLLCDGSSYSRTTYAALFAALNVSIGTVTISLASPGVVTFASAHGLTSSQTIFLTTTGALPTGLAANTTYWVQTVSPTAVRVAASLALYEAGTFINTSGSQSGVHTALRTVGGVASVTTFNVPDLRGRVLADSSAAFGVGGATGADTTTITAANMPSHTHTYSIPSHTHSYTDTYYTYTAQTLNDRIYAPLDDPRTYATGITGTDNSSNYTTDPSSGTSATSGSAGGSASVSISNFQPTFFVYSHIKY